MLSDNIITKKLLKTLYFTAELDFTAWARLSWTDERLKWDPEEYHNITIFRVPANRVWVPDMEIYNAIGLT